MKGKWLTTATIMAVLFVIAAAPAWACLNDREVHTLEREFKSNYNGPSPQAAVPVSTDSAPTTFATVAIGGLGALLFVAGGVLVELRRRRTQ